MGELNEEPLGLTTEQEGHSYLADITTEQQPFGQEPMASTLQTLIQAEQKRRSIREYVGDLRKAKALLLAIGLAVGVTACGSGSSSASKAVRHVGPAATTTIPNPNTFPSSTTTTVPPTPTEHYIALCDGTDIEYLDPTTAKVLKTIQVNANFGTFTPSIRYDSNASGDEHPTCGQWSYNGTLDKISGLDTENGTKVPAIYDLLTGKITDLVTPPSESSTTTTIPFATPTTPPPSYDGAYFDPANQDVFWLESSGGGNTNKIIDQSGVIATYGYPQTCEGSPLGVTFKVDSTMPVVGCIPSIEEPGPNGQAGNWSILDTPVQNNAEGAPELLTEQESQFGVDFALPTSNYYWNIIRRSDDGSGAAFVAYQSNEQSYGGPFIHSDCTLFTVDATSGAPQAAGQLSSCGSPYTYDVIRYVP